MEMGPNGTIATRREGEILFVSLTAPVGEEGIANLSVELEDLRNGLLLDHEVRVVLLAGADERAFSIVSGKEDGAGPWEEGSLAGSLAGPIAALEIPVIAAIRGDAVGRGLEMALACDVRIAAETSKFGLPQITSGQIPRDGGTQRLARMVGRGKALEMILTGQPIDAGEALRIGLVSRIVPGEAVVATALALAREMAAKAPISLRYIKEAVLSGTEMPLAEGLRLEGDLYLLLQTTRDREEGIGAFHRKEAPRFEGR